MIPMTVPMLEDHWVAFKARVLDRTFKAIGGEPPAPFLLMLHDTFYAGALTLFGLEQKAGDDEWQALAHQIEAYYNEALRRAAEVRPVQ